MTKPTTPSALRWRWQAQLEMKSGVSLADSTDFLNRLTAYATAIGAECDASGGPLHWEILLDSATINDGLRLTEWLAKQPELAGYRLGPSEIAK